MCHMEKLDFVLLDALAKLKTRENRTKKDHISLQLLALLVKLTEMFIKMITERSMSIVHYWQDCPGRTGF